MFEPITDRSTPLADGRRLAFAEWGDLEGPAVVFVHGTPHSRLWCPDVAVTRAAGVHLVTIDRPGYGQSDPAPPELSVRDWVSDLSQLSDALGIGQFGVVGWSGGSTYALACAAVIPDRLTGAGEVGGAGWPILEEPGAYEELDDDDRRIFDLAQTDPAAAAQLADKIQADWVNQLSDDPASIWDGSEPTQDLCHFEDQAWAESFFNATREALRQGTAGTAWDTVANDMPWGFSLEDVVMDFHLWHGDLEPYESMASVEYWETRIPRAQVTTYPNSGHFAVVDHWEEILTTVVGH